MWKLIFMAVFWDVAYPHGISYTDRPRAVAELTVGKVKGSVEITVLADGNTDLVFGLLKNLYPPGYHGIAIHESGDLKGDCKNAKGHFNPTNKEHGAPSAPEHHLGDLGNIVAQYDGRANVSVVTVGFEFTGKNSIVGRSFVVSAGEDDLGKGTEPDSKTTGHSGGPIACGVIKLFKEEPSSHQSPIQSNPILWLPVLMSTILTSFEWC